MMLSSLWLRLQFLMFRLETKCFAHITAGSISDPPQLTNFNIAEQPTPATITSSKALVWRR